MSKGGKSLNIIASVIIESKLRKLFLLDPIGARDASFPLISSPQENENVFSITVSNNEANDIEFIMRRSVVGMLLFGSLYELTSIKDDDKMKMYMNEITQSYLSDLKNWLSSKALGKFEDYVQQGLELQDAKTQIKILQYELLNLKKGASSNEEIKVYKELVDKKDKEIERYKNEIELIDTGFKALKIQKESELRLKDEEFKAYELDTNKKITELRSTIMSNNKVIQKGEDEIKTLKEDLSKMEGEVKKMEVSMDQLMEQLRENARDINSKTSELKKEKSNGETLKRALEDRKDTIDIMGKRNSKLEEELKKLKEELENTDETKNEEKKKTERDFSSLNDQMNQVIQWYLEVWNSYGIHITEIARDNVNDMEKLRSNVSKDESNYNQDIIRIFKRMVDRNIGASGALLVAVNENVSNYEELLSKIKKSAMKEKNFFTPYIGNEAKIKEITMKLYDDSLNKTRDIISQSSFIRALHTVAEHLKGNNFNSTMDDPSVLGISDSINSVNFKEVEREKEKDK